MQDNNNNQDQGQVVNEPVNPGAETPVTPVQPVTPVEGETPNQPGTVEKTNIPVEDVSRAGEQVVHTGEEPAGQVSTE